MMTFHDMWKKVMFLTSENELRTANKEMPAIFVEPNLCLN